jgi:hypothetical protein
MALSKDDIRYQGVCIKCHAKLGDWALKVPFEQRLCWNCRPHDIKNIPYKNDWTQEEEENWIRSHFD